LTIKTDTARTEWHINLQSALDQNLGNCFLGCNLFMSRSVYERLGPFDEQFGVGRIPAGEVFRAYAAGIRLEYVPNIVVSHHHGRRTLDQARGLWRNYMIASGALYAKHFFTCGVLGAASVWSDHAINHGTRLGLQILAQVFSGSDLEPSTAAFSWATVPALFTSSDLSDARSPKCIFQAHMYREHSGGDRLRSDRSSLSNWLRHALDKRVRRTPIATPLQCNGEDNSPAKTIEALARELAGNRCRACAAAPAFFAF
jgi:hypothetical protein